MQEGVLLRLIEQMLYQEISKVIGMGVFTNPQDQTVFTIWTNFTKSWGWAFGHHVLMLVLLMLM